MSCRPTHPTQRLGLLSFASRKTKGNNALQVLRDIRDCNPDAALVIWNTLRLANPGYELHVHRLENGADDEPVPYNEAQEALAELLARAGREYGGGLYVLIDVFDLTLMSQGGTAVVLDLSVIV